jgi:hypothetical protein
MYENCAAKRLKLQFGPWLTSLSLQPPPTGGLRTFGNSYPQSSVGIHPIPLIAAGFARESGTIRSLSDVGGYHGVACLFGGRTFIHVAERLR